MKKYFLYKQDFITEIKSPSYTKRVKNIRLFLILYLPKSVGVYVIEGERKQKHKQIIGSCPGVEKSMEYESDCENNFIWSKWRNLRSKKEVSKS